MDKTQKSTLTQTLVNNLFSTTGRNYTMFLHTVKVIFTGLTVANTLFAMLSLPVTAQMQNKQESRQCRAAVQAAKNKIEKNRNVKVGEIIDNLPLNDAYSDYPKNRPFEYAFALDSSATRSILKSPRLLLPIATDIIKNCPSVSLVSFRVYGTYRADTAPSAAFGLMKDGKVKQWQCIDPPPNRFRWGQYNLTGCGK
jgi:hypothetical protein